MLETPACSRCQSRVPHGRPSSSSSSSWHSPSPPLPSLSSPSTLSSLPSTTLSPPPACSSRALASGARPLAPSPWPAWLEPRPSSPSAPESPVLSPSCSSSPPSASPSLHRGRHQSPQSRFLTSSQSTAPASLRSLAPPHQHSRQEGRPEGRQATVERHQPQAPCLSCPNPLLDTRPISRRATLTRFPFRTTPAEWPQRHAWTRITV
mmetsp:Transcript_21069/g.71235  ORF Transcript_21069/g.71235 Transcript_21069/m.71235 type:complete len:207 (+) Transcript_21069:124-744(+)